MARRVSLLCLLFKGFVHALASATFGILMAITTSMLLGDQPPVWSLWVLAALITVITWRFGPKQFGAIFIGAAAATGLLVIGLLIGFSLAVRQEDHQVADRLFLSCAMATVVAAAGVAILYGRLNQRYRWAT